MSGGIIIFSETDQGTFELLTKGRELSKVLNMELLALAIGRKAENLQPYLEYGAQRVLLIPHDGVLDTDAYTQMLSEVAKDDGPDIVLIRSTRAGKELAGRVAQKLQAGCVTDALNLTAKNSDLVVDRYALGGNTISSEVIRTKKKVISVMPGAFESQKAPAQGKIETLSIAPPPRRVELVERKKKESESVNIESAEALVCVGKGLSAKEDLAMVRDLCAALKAELGCTRTLSADYHWLSEDRMVGISGKRCKPKLHVSIGISGQIQHTVGIMSSKLIIAINKDKEAPIFKMADYGIVGDLYQVVPKLVQRIQTRGS